ncbi:hypothetical protein R1sor_020962 [Riccia sorocarpa]|uniref:Uncharacterized protein n=1 Tax=Riccia sorocarpa TaxID=122646 RepID=A0ABD3GH55_9MARC
MSLCGPLESQCTRSCIQREEEISPKKIGIAHEGPSETATDISHVETSRLYRSELSPGKITGRLVPSGGGGCPADREDDRPHFALLNFHRPLHSCIHCPVPNQAGIRSAPRALSFLCDFRRFYRRISATVLDTDGVSVNIHAVATQSGERS